MLKLIATRGKTDDPLDPARGCVNGLLLSAVLWIVIAWASCYPW